MSEKAALVTLEANARTVEYLSRKYGKVLLRYFARRGFSDDDAQDLSQEVFARIAQKGGMDQVVRVDGYLFATAANIAVEYFRRRKVRNANPVESFYEAVQRSEEFTPERILEGREELVRVVAALNEMPERMRNIFILARLENLPRAEIAKRLGVSKRLVEHQITLATACLADRRRRLV